MSYHEGSNWQARKEDEGKPLYENKPKQSSPIGDVEQIAADEIMHLFELSLYEESGYKVTKAKIIEILNGVAGSQWASPRPTAKAMQPSKEVLSLTLNFLIDYYESKKNKPPQLANVIVELQQIVINQLDETPAHPTAEFCEGEDDIAFDFHKANDHPTAVNGDEKFFCRHEYDGNERCETVCGLCSQVKPKAAAPKGDDVTVSLRAALTKAVELIKTWHNMQAEWSGMRKEIVQHTWDIYWRSAPEMKVVREAVEAGKPAADWKQKLADHFRRGSFDGFNTDEQSIANWIEENVLNQTI